MSALELWLFRRIVDKAMRQDGGRQHIKTLLTEIVCVYRERFYEDNRFTARAVLNDWMSEAFLAATTKDAEVSQ